MDRHFFEIQKRYRFYTKAAKIKPMENRNLSCALFRRRREVKDLFSYGSLREPADYFSAV